MWGKLAWSAAMNAREATGRVAGGGKEVAMFERQKAEKTAKERSRLVLVIIGSLILALVVGVVAYHIGYRDGQANRKMTWEKLFKQAP
jgi:hypothetical protein